MKAAEFEEKEYEGALYRELARGNKFWPPGQVLESYLGFDAALFVDDPHFWHLHNIRRWQRGFSLYSAWPDLPWKRLRRSRLPRFRVNCFLQAKRPHIGSRMPSRLAALGKRRPFFRFSIESDQQRILEAAAKRLAGRALFTYAAPVFGKSQQLFGHMSAGAIVANSTFPDVASLTGQHVWFYNEPGAVGVVNRSFRHLRMSALEARVEGLASEYRNLTEDEQSPSTALEELLKELQRVIVEEETTSRAAYLIDEWGEIAALREILDAPPALFSFLGVEAFAIYFNVLWLTIV